MGFEFLHTAFRIRAIQFITNFVFLLDVAARGVDLEMNFNLEMGVCFSGEN